MGEVELEQNWRVQVTKAVCSRRLYVCVSKILRDVGVWRGGMGGDGGGLM